MAGQLVDSTHLSIDSKIMPPVSKGALGSTLGALCQQQLAVRSGVSMTGHA